MARALADPHRISSTVSRFPGRGDNLLSDDLGAAAPHAQCGSRLHRDLFDLDRGRSGCGRNGGAEEQDGGDRCVDRHGEIDQVAEALDVRLEVGKRQREVYRLGNMDDEGHRFLQLAHKIAAHSQVALVEVTLERNDPFGVRGRDGNLFASGAGTPCEL